MRAQKILYIFLLFILIITIILPIFMTLGSINLSDFALVFFEHSYTKTILNTIIITIVSSALSTLIGFFYAYIIIRRKIIFRKFFAFIPIIHLVTPPVVSGLSFILLFGKNGFVIHNLLHADISLYGFWGIIFSQVIYFFPISYIINSIAIKNVNAQHIAAARLMGAGSVKIFFSITLPESLAGILSSILFIAVSVMSDFGNPIIVGGRFQVLSTEIYSLVTGAIEPKKATVLAVILLIPSLILFLLQNTYFIKNQERFATVGSNNFSSTGNVTIYYTAKNLKTNVSILCGTIFCAFFTLIILSQFLSVIIGAFQKLWGVDPAPTLSHIKNLFNYKESFLNTLSFSFIATFITVIIAIFTAFFAALNISRKGCKKIFASLVDIISQAPQAICGVMLGLCYSYTAGIFSVTNYTPLIICVMVVMFLPFAHKTITTSFLQQKEQLTLSAITLGARPLYALFTVNIPLAFRAINAAFIYTFARCIGTLSAIIFLVSFDTKTISLFILNLTGQGDWGEACSLALCLTILTIFIIIIAVKLKPRSFYEKN